MSNAELFKKVKDLDLTLGEYVLFGSTPLGVRGLRECHDADMIVSERVWEQFKDKSGWELKRLSDGREVLENSMFNIEMGTSWGPGKWDCSKIIQKAEIFDGLPFARLEYVWEWKKRFGREKDLKDMEIIKIHLDSIQS